MTPQPLLVPMPNMGGLYMITHDFELPNFGVVAPGGFLTDGASIPRWLWAVTYHPFHSDIVAGAVAHDWVYLNHQMPRSDADTMIHKIILANGANPVKAKLIYDGVNAFGGFAWPNSEKDLFRIKCLYETVKDSPRFEEYHFPVEVLRAA